MSKLLGVSAGAMQELSRLQPPPIAEGHGDHLAGAMGALLLLAG